MTQRSTRYGISFEQVAAAASALTAAGQRPSLRAVRSQLGDTGSLSTIQKHMEAWMQGQEPEDDPRIQELLTENAELKAQLKNERRAAESMRTELIRLRMRVEALSLLKR